MHLPKPNSRRFCATVVIGILLTSALTAAIMLNPAFAAWWDYSWQYRKSVTVDHAKVAGSLSSFPVLVGVTDADLASKAKSNGDDICFADLDGNKLDHEIELYSSVSGHLVAWVRVPTLSSVSDTVFYMYYGNPSASNQQNPAGVWDSNFRMVQHLEEASGTCNDSTSYHNNGRPMNGVVQNANGKIDGACDFDGTNDYTDVGSDASIDDLTQITVSAWIKMDAVGPGATIYDKNFTKGKSVYVHTSGYLCFVQAFTGGSPSPYGWWRTSAATLSAGSWYYVTVTYDSSSSANDPQLYLNGALCSYVEGNAPSGTALSDASYNATVGGAISALNVFTNGIIDEARVSSISRSSAWISTEYNNQLSPSTFYTVGTEEIGTPPPTPELTNESPRDGAVDVALNPTLSIHAKDYQGDLMTLIFSTNASGAWTELGRYTNVGEGTYDQTTVTMDSYNTRYYWRVCATDGTNWNNMTYTFKTMPTWWNPLWQYRKSVTVITPRLLAVCPVFLCWSVLLTLILLLRLRVTEMIYALPIWMETSLIMRLNCTVVLVVIWLRGCVCQPCPRLVTLFSTCTMVTRRLRISRILQASGTVTSVWFSIWRKLQEASLTVRETTMTARLTAVSLKAPQEK